MAPLFSSLDVVAHAVVLESDVEFELILVADLISHSGTALSFPTNNRTTVAKHWYTVSAQLGCGSSEDVLSFMRKQNAGAILAAASALKVPTTNPARKSPAFQPTVENVTVFENYTLLSQQGKFARIVNGLS